jgi:hypothetical protein
MRILDLGMAEVEARSHSELPTFQHARPIRTPTR